MKKLYLFLLSFFLWQACVPLNAADSSSADSGAIAQVDSHNHQSARRSSWLNLQRKLFSQRYYQKIAAGKSGIVDDRITTQSFPNEGLDIYAVFDGYRGSEVADRLQRRLCFILAKRISELSSRRRMRPRYVQTQIQKAFRGMAQELTQSAEAIGDSCATATVVIIDRLHQKLYLAHIGNSRAIVVDAAGELMHETREHCPCEEGEQRRLLKDERRLGLYGDSPLVYQEEDVLCLSETGLAVCRCFGAGHHLSVSIAPDIEVFDLAGLGYIFIATRSVWDAVPTSEVVKVANRKRKSHRRGLHRAVDILMRRSRKKREERSVLTIDLETYTADDPTLAALPARVPVGRASASEPPRVRRRGRVELLWPLVTTPPRWESDDESDSERRFSGPDGPWVPTQSMSQSDVSDAERTLTDSGAPLHESASVTGSYSFDPDKTLSLSGDS